MTTPEVAIEIEGQPTANPESDAFVVFGATRDLAHKKFFPALHNMVRHGTLNVTVIGIAKSRWSIDQLRERARDSIEKFGGGVDEAALAVCCNCFTTIDGDYGRPATFSALRTLLGSARRSAHYLAIPPSLFATVRANGHGG